MKIYGDYSFLIEKPNVIYDSRVQIVQNNTKIVEFADSFIQDQKAASQDQAVISKEGMDYIRDQLSDLSSGSLLETEDGRTLTLQRHPSRICRRDDLTVQQHSQDLHNAAAGFH